MPQGSPPASPFRPAPRSRRASYVGTTWVAEGGPEEAQPCVGWTGDFQASPSTPFPALRTTPKTSSSPSSATRASAAALRGLCLHQRPRWALRVVRTTVSPHACKLHRGQSGLRPGRWWSGQRNTTPGEKCAQHPRTPELGAGTARGAGAAGRGGSGGSSRCLQPLPGSREGRPLRAPVACSGDEAHRTLQGRADAAPYFGPWPRSRGSESSGSDFSSLRLSFPIYKEKPWALFPWGPCQYILWFFVTTKGQMSVNSIFF